MPNQDEVREFVKHAEGAQPGLLREFFQLLRHTKKWWLTPIVLALLFVGFLVLLSGTIAAPFIYTLF